MATHIGILPLGVLDTLTLQLDERTSESGLVVNGLKFMKLPHPRTGDLSLFLPPNPDIESSPILEVQCISQHSRRSWFNEGQIISDGKLLIMTPIDPVFLLFPILHTSSPAGASSGTFRTIDDIFEDAATKLSYTGDSSDEPGTQRDINMNDIITLSRLSCTQDALKRVCEIKEITTDLTVYRFSREKFLGYILKKVKRLSAGDIIDKSRTLVRELAKDALMDDGNEALLESGKLKIACDMISQYVPQDLYQELIMQFDFSALDVHIQALQGLDTQKNASGTEKKNALGGDQDVKKRKATVQGSRGAEKLKKANVKGMAKLSSFFQKQSTKA